MRMGGGRKLKHGHMIDLLISKERNLSNNLLFNNSTEKAKRTSFKVLVPICRILTCKVISLLNAAELNVTFLSLMYDRVHSKRKLCDSFTLH